MFKMTKLTILVTAVGTVGHINACVGALSTALSQGHRIIFILEKAFTGKVASLGFEEFFYENVNSSGEVQSQSSIYAKNALVSQLLGTEYSTLQKCEALIGLIHFDGNYCEIAAMDRAIKDAIKQFVPDLIYFDGVLLYPSVYYSGIPWVKNHSLNPICCIFDDQVSSGWSGMLSDLSFDVGK